MIRPDKDIANEHPFAKKPKVDRVETADVFNLRDYGKYIQAVEDGNVHEIFPDTAIGDLEKMRKIYEKQLAKDPT